jgi:hypothetical protein
VRTSDPTENNKIMKMQTFITLDKAKPDWRKFKNFKLGGGRAYDSSND